MLFKDAVEAGTLELLRKLQTTDILRDFHLAGGTALALQIGHRKSIDLDLFTHSSFDVEYVLGVLERYFDFYSDYTSVNTIKGSVNFVKTDLIAHQYPLVDKIITDEGVRLYSLPDIAAMKLNAIAGNGTRFKDFIDIYFILQQFTLKEILGFYKVKYKQRNLLHVLKSLVYFDDINYSDAPEMIREKTLHPETVKNFLLDAVKNYSQDFTG
jgi:hypothetical protein